MAVLLQTPGGNQGQYSLGFKSWDLGSGNFGFESQLHLELHGLGPLLAFLSPGVQGYKMGLVVVPLRRNTVTVKHKAHRAHGPVLGHISSSKNCEIPLKDNPSCTCAKLRGRKVLPSTKSLSFKSNLGCCPFLTDILVVAGLLPVLGAW